MSSLTDKAILQTFETLLTEKNLDDITVKELVERCGINRKTFYRHYHNIPDLIASQAARGITASVGDKIYPENWEQGVLQAMLWLQNHSRPVRHTFYSSYYDEIRRDLTPMLDSILDQNISRALEIYNSRTGRDLAFSEPEYKMIRHYFSAIVFTFFEEWIASGMKNNPEEYVDTMSLLIHDDMYPMFDRIYERHRALSS